MSVKLKVGTKRKKTSSETTAMDSGNVSLVLKAEIDTLKQVIANQRSVLTMFREHSHHHVLDRVHDLMHVRNICTACYLDSKTCKHCQYCLSDECKRCPVCKDQLCIGGHTYNVDTKQCSFWEQRKQEEQATMESQKVLAVTMAQQAISAELAFSAKYNT